MSPLGLTVTLSLKDMISDKWDKLVGKLSDFEKQIQKDEEALKKFKSSLNGLAWGSGFMVSSLALAKGMINARMETSKLEANIRSLGVSSEEVDKISNSVMAMSGQYGIAKETFLGGIYDIKSAVSSLDPANLAAISGEMGKLATATKGDFGGLSDVFGTAYAQFKNSYKALTDTEFAKMFANTISFAANAYKTDGAKMQQAMQSLGASASSLGVSFEEQTAVLGRLQNTALAGVSGTSYRAFLSNVSKGFADLGLKATDAQGKLKSLPDLLAQLEGKFGDLDTGEIDQLKKAFGTEEAVGFIKELLPFSEQLRSEIDSLKQSNSGGKLDFVDAMAAENLNSMSSSFARLREGWRSLVDLFSKGIGDNFLGPLVGSLADVLHWALSLADAHPVIRKLMTYVGGAATTLLFLGGAFVAVRSGLAFFRILMLYSNTATKAGIRVDKLKIFSLARLNAGFLSATGTIQTFTFALWAKVKAFFVAGNAAKIFGLALRGLKFVGLIGGIVPVVYGLFWLWKNWDKDKEWLGNGWEYVKKKWNILPGWLKLVFWPITLLISIGKSLVANWDSIANFFKVMWKRIVGFFRSPLGMIVAMLNPNLSMADFARGERAYWIEKGKMEAEEISENIDMILNKRL